MYARTNEAAVFVLPNAEDPNEFFIRVDPAADMRAEQIHLGIQDVVALAIANFISEYQEEFIAFLGAVSEATKELAQRSQTEKLSDEMVQEIMTRHRIDLSDVLTSAEAAYQGNPPEASTPAPA